MRIVGAIDRFQQRHAWTAFPYAVLRKYGEDRGGHQAALIAFYGFFALFPLMLVGVTVLGMLLRNDAALQEQLVGSALAAFPVIGEQIRENVRGLEGAGVALVVGLAGALWAGLAGVNAVQISMDEVWDVPVRARPGLLARLRRGITMLAALGLMTVIAAGIATFATADTPAALRVAALAASFALNTATFLVAFTVLPSARVPWRDAVPGALLAGAGWLVLQAVGGALVQHRLRGATETYGFFAIVLGLLSWMLLSAQLMVLSAEVNVVRRERLWPRSMGAAASTDADRRALADRADVEERAVNQDVSVDFDPPRRRVG